MVRNEVRVSRADGKIIRRLKVGTAEVEILTDENNNASSVRTVRGTISTSDLLRIFQAAKTQEPIQVSNTINTTMTLPTSTVFNSFNQALGAGLSAVMWTPPVGKSTNILHFHLGVTWNASPADYVMVQDGDGTTIGLFFPMWYNPVTDVYGGDYDIMFKGSGITTASKGTSVEVFNGSGVTAIVVIGTIDGNEV